MSAPPAEAVKQDDGSYVLHHEDGSLERWTRRPDGTWRKPERRRAGWVGDLEQKKYVSRGAAVEAQRTERMKAELGMVPGLPPGAAPAAANSTAASRKNERRKEQRKEKAEAAVSNGGYSAAPAPVAPAAPSPAAAAPAPAEPSANPARAIEKKLRQVADLEQRAANGEQLDAAQLAKIAGKAALEAELAAVRNGGSVSGTAAAAEGAKEQAVAAPSSVAAEPAPAAAAPNRRTVEKKLRQISELEERQAKGETLNEDQLAKLMAKASLEDELKRCA